MNKDIKPGYLAFFSFVLFAGILLILFVLLASLKSMQQEINLSFQVGELALQRTLPVTPTPTMATPSATLTPATGIRVFRGVVSPTK